MENVVYILGAGFSAPLSLAVISNFLMKSKDMYFSDPERFQHFQRYLILSKMMRGTGNPCVLLYQCKSNIE